MQFKTVTLCKPVMSDEGSGGHSEEGLVAVRSVECRGRCDESSTCEDKNKSRFVLVQSCVLRPAE